MAPQPRVTNLTIYPPFRSDSKKNLYSRSLLYETCKTAEALKGLLQGLLRSHVRNLPNLRPCHLLQDLLILTWLSGPNDSQYGHRGFTVSGLVCRHILLKGKDILQAL